MHSNIMELNDTFRNLVLLYRTAESKKQKSFKSINNECSILSTFLLEMQNAGAKDLSDITTKMAGSFFYEKNRQIRSSTYANRLKYILNILNEQTGEKLSFQIPFVKKREKVFKPFDEDFSNNVKHSINTDGNQWTLRDRAIIALSAYTGMRGSDIANLTIDDIDWVNERITLIQSKTGQKLVLPLRAVFGDSIYDYLKNERPENFVNKNLFFNEKCDGVSISSGTVGGVIERFFTRLGLKCEGKQRRLRILRHYLASKLLHNGNMPAVISGILGHIRPESLDPYIDEDIENMRTCALDVSMFPIENELFQ